MEPRRVRTSLKDSSFIYDYQSSDSDDSDRPKKRQKSKRDKKKDEDEWNSHEDQSEDEGITKIKRSKSVQARKKAPMGGPMLFVSKDGIIGPAEGEDFDVHKSPSGDPCRFAKLEEILPIILDTSAYLKSGETGINTVLPELEPMKPEKLQFFGLKSDLVETSLDTIAKMTDEQLEEELKKTDTELTKYNVKLENIQVVVPAFDETMTQSVSIKADVCKFDFHALGKIVKFDVITLDPPWQIAFSSVTRGVAINYDQLDVSLIERMPLQSIQTDGYIFMWVIASQFSNGVQMLTKWGYDFVTYLNWTKISKYGRYMPSHGYYLQHNKETCLIGKKGRDPEGIRPEKFQDLIVAQRGLRQSHKPLEMYEIIEKVFPDSLYLEIFARPHNLRQGWISLGIELPD